MTPRDVADAVLAAYALWGPGPPVGGEWANVRAHARAALLAALEAGDRDLLATIACRPQGRVEWSGLESPSSQAAFDADCRTRAALLGSSALWEMLCADAEGCYQDAPRLDGEAWSVLRYSPRRVLEIGGGYGCFGLSLQRRGPGVQYVDIDLPDTLFLAYGFLATRVPAGTVGFGYEAARPLNLVPHHAIPPLGVFDVVVNYRSFGEMEPVAVARYFALIAEVWRPRWVVHENSVFRTQAAPTSVDFPELLVADYPPLPGYVLRAVAPSRWCAGAGRYMRHVLERTP